MNASKSGIRLIREVSSHLSLMGFPISCECLIVLIFIPEWVILAVDAARCDSIGRIFTPTETR